MDLFALDLGPDTEKLKAAYAELLLFRPDNAFAAAQQLFRNDAGKALYAAQNWPNDAYVLKVQEQLLDERGEDAFSITRSNLARMVQTEADSCHDKDIKLKYLKFLAELKGWIGTESKGSTITAQNVMIVQNNGSDQDWERAAQAQQEQLIAEAKIINNEVLGET
jgi:hypothetical protein